MIIKYMLLGVFSIYSVCAGDQPAAAAAGLDEVEQRFLRIRTQAGDIEVDEAGIEALGSEVINNMIAGDSDVLSVSGDVSADNKAISDGLDLSRHFENADQFTAFANAMQEGRYQSEPIDMVLRILKAGNYLLVYQEKINRYMESVARVNPLLLYQLSHDASLPQGLSALISKVLIQVVPFQLQQRLGAVVNDDPFHTGWIFDVAVVDADTIVIGSEDHTVIIWHKDVGGVWQMQQRLGVVDNDEPAAGHTAPIIAVAVVDGDTIVTGSRDRTAIVWHKNADGVWQFQQRLGAVDNQDQVAGHTDVISAVAVVDADTIVTGSRDRTAIVWHKDADGVWQLQQRLGAVDNYDPAVGHKNWINAVAVVDAHTIVTGSRDCTAIVWHKDAEGVWQFQQRLGAAGNRNPLLAGFNNQDPKLGHTDEIAAVAAVDADTIVTGSSDRTVIVWHKDADGVWQLQQRLGVPGLKAKKFAFQLSDYNKFGHIATIFCVAVVDPNTIVTGSADRTAVVWHKNAEGVWQFQQRLSALFEGAHKGGIKAVAVVDPNTIMTGSADDTVIVWHRDIEGYFAPQL